MSFGDSSFAGGHVRITQKMCLKYMRNTTIQTSDMSPRGEGPVTRQIRAQSGGEKVQSPYQITSNWRQTLQGLSRSPKKTNSQSWAHLGPVGGAAPLVRPHHFWGPIASSFRGC
jgi:hypothetical protein